MCIAWGHRRGRVPWPTQRSASNDRLSWSGQAYNILSQYQAILDITTSLSLNTLFGFKEMQIPPETQSHQTHLTLRRVVLCLSRSNGN